MGPQDRILSIITIKLNFVYLRIKLNSAYLKIKLNLLSKPSLSKITEKKLLSTFYVVLTFYCFAPDSTLVNLLKFLFRDSHIFFPYVQCQIKEVASNV